MSSPSNINLNDLVPSAKVDTFNVEWQGDTPVPDPNSPGNFVRNASACYRVPQVGGVIVLDDNYQLSETDSGLLLIANLASAITFTLPSIIPALAPGQGVWNVIIVNIGVGAVTIDPNGLNLDGSGSTLALEQFQAISLSTDGTDYYSGLKASGFIGGVIANTGTSVTISNTHRQKLLTTSNGSAIAVTLSSAVGKGFICWTINLGAGTATLTPSSGNINGSANLALTTGQGCALFFNGTDWYAVTGGGSGSSTLAADTDVSISSPANRDLLIYHSSDSKWHNDVLVAADIPNLAASKITSGQLALARGGTGVDLSATGGTTKILAQDGSHVISARDLIAADIPNIAESQVTSLVSDLALKAPLASPTFTGTPAAPTAGAGTNTTQIATTAFVIGQQVYDVAVFFPGTQQTASQVISRIIPPRAVAFAAGLSPSTATAITAATGSTVFDVQKNGSQVGTITFAVAGTSGTFAAASGFSFNGTSDVLSIVGPATPDSSLADIGIVLSGTR